MADNDRDLQAYLARIRKTIAESESLVSQAKLRIDETDRMLEAQGLTREQVLNFRFTAAQREAVNEELRRRGLDPVDFDEETPYEADGAFDPAPATLPPAESSAELADRQRKLGMMMKPFQI